MRMKLLIIIASILLIVGVTGSILQFPNMINTEETTTTEVVSSNGIDQIDVKVTSAKIHIVPTDSDEIRAELISNETEVELIAEVNNQTVHIEVKNKMFPIFEINFLPRTSSLTIYLPKKQYAGLSIKSTNGKMEIEDVAATDISLNSKNGAIHLEDIQADTISTKLNNGRIELENVTAITSSVYTDNGKITLANVTGDITGKTNNGLITYHTEKLAQAIDFHSSNGKINIFTEKQPTNVTYDLRADLGKIRVFEKSDWDTVTGNGEHVIKLRTNNGSITIAHPE